MHVYTICLITLLGMLVGCGPDGDSDFRQQAVEVSVAASLTDAMTELGARFEMQHGIRVHFNFASSGALAQQIQAAGGTDVFLSASEHWMDTIDASGKLMKETRSMVLKNQLVIVSNLATDLILTSGTELCSASFRYLSIGDPSHVPAGQYARDWLQSVQCPNGEAAWDSVQDRLLPATDARAALAQVEAGRDIIGIVYDTDYQSRADAFTLLYTIPADETPDIRYSAAVLGDTDQEQNARAFLDFLKSGQAAEIFQRHGFRVPGDSASN